MKTLKHIVHIIHGLKIYILALLLITQTSEAQNIGKMAHFLSIRIPFMSPRVAHEYVGKYRSHLMACIGKDKWEDKKMQTCQDEAVKVISQLFKENEDYLLHRLNQYARDGHISFTGTPPDPKHPTVGIIGDSLAAGTLAAGNVHADDFKLAYTAFDVFALLSNPSVSSNDAVDRFTGNSHLVPVMNRKLRTRKTSNSFVIKVFDTPQQKKLSSYAERMFFSYVDCEECSFAYHLAIEQRIPSHNIIVSAKGNDQKVRTLYGQIEKVALPFGHLPEYVFISFTGNDICSMEMENTSQSKKYSQYYQDMVRQLQKAVQEIKPSPKGTHVIVVAAADVTNLVVNKELLDKYVANSSIKSVFGGGVNKKTTCRDIRLGKAHLSEVIHGMCRYILSASPFDKERIGHIGALHQAVVSAQRDAVRKLQQNQPDGFNFYFIDDILDTEFQPEDISPDCFHPSVQGHKRIASELSEEVGTIFRGSHSH